MFAVVAFDETCEMDFVPVEWVAGGVKPSEVRRQSVLKFYWPPMRSATAVANAQKQRTVPEIHWPVYNGRVLATASKKMQCYILY